MLTYGGGWVGGFIIRAEAEAREKVLNRALEEGIDWIDTAAAYGNGASETVLGEWLPKVPKDKRPRISTKFNIDASAPDFAGQVERSVTASLGRLGLGRVPLLILHNRIVEEASPDRNNRSLTARQVLAKGGVADILDALRAKGLCDWIGLTGLGDSKALHEVIDSGRFDVAQIYYNLLNPTAMGGAGPRWNTTDFDGLLHRCAAKDVGTMGIRIFAAGHLATTERHGREMPITANADSPAEEVRAKAALEVLGNAYGRPAQAALRFGLACPLLSTIEVGIGEAWHLDEALAAVAMGPLPADAIAQLDQLRRTHPAFRA
ncbi:MAG TPA: aldo/keto reductase [Hyphomicrobiaceae bacterium]|nr:aldo/keto reductase [Hyphomicrobiaceae bacterium]